MKRKTESFLQSVIVLMFSQVLVKLLGMIYSLYLTNKQGFGDSGNAICTSAYQIYAIFLTIASIGIPNAISKMVAESLSVGDVIGSKRIFKVAILVFSTIGMVCSIILYIFSDFIANTILQISAASNILKILAPSIVFVSIEAVIRGYFNGKQRMKVSARIQTLEQILKTIVTILLVESISRITYFNTEIMAEVAMFAASIVTFASFIYAIKEYLKIKKEDVTEIIMGNNKLKKTISNILKEMFSITVPIAITSFLMILESNIDSITIIRLLKDKVGEEMAKEKYGILSSKVTLLTNMPLSINGAIAVALIPEVAKMIANGNSKELENKINFSFLITVFISLPIMIIMNVYSQEIMNLLYPNANKGAELLKIASLTIVFTSLTQTMSGMLQGIGLVNFHLKIMSVAMIVKIILNLILIPIPELLEKGAIISSIIYDVIIFILIFNKIQKKLKLKFNLFFNIIKVFFIVMISIFISKVIISKIFFYNKNLKFIIEIIIWGILYIIFTIMFKVFGDENLSKCFDLGKNRKFQKN